MDVYLRYLLNVKFYFFFIQRSFVTATRTRRKLQAEMVKTALEAEEKKRRIERENFLLTTVPVTIQAAYEPALHHVTADDHEEGTA